MTVRDVVSRFRPFRFVLAELHIVCVATVHFIAHGGHLIYVKSYRMIAIDLAVICILPS